MSTKQDNIEIVVKEITRMLNDLRPYEKIMISADGTGMPENVVIQREQKIAIRTVLLASKIDTSKIRPLDE